MSFSLKKYIKENYLNERLQSNILINEILYDSGGFFRYYKMPFENSQYKKVLDAYDFMQATLTGLFGSNTRRYLDPKVYGTDIDTDEKAYDLYKLFNDKCDYYYKTVPNIFKKVEPRILISLMSFSQGDMYLQTSFYDTYLDLFNLTDDNFEVYTLMDVKRDQSLKKEISDKLKEYTGFWVDSNKKLQAITRFGKILLFAPDNNRSKIIKQKEAYKKLACPDSTEELDELVSLDTLKENSFSYRYKLDNGEYLQYDTPVLSRYWFGKTGKKEVGIQYIKKHLDLSELEINTSNLFDIGAFYVSDSNIRKYSDWGHKNTDKIIIYIPSERYEDSASGTISKIERTKGDLTNMPSTNNLYGYNEYKHRKYLNYRQQKQRDDAKDIAKSHYKWIRDILGKYLPYAGGKDSKYLMALEHLEDDDFLKMYGSDTYCSEIAYKNHVRYKYEASKLKLSLKNVQRQIKEPLDNLLKTLETYTIKGEQFSKAIKTTRNTPIFQEIMESYYVYQQTVSYCIGEIARIQQLYKRYIDIYHNDKREVRAHEKSEVNEKFEELVTLVNDLQVFMNQLTELDEKINGKLTD